MKDEGYSLKIKDCPSDLRTVGAYALGCSDLHSSSKLASVSEIRVFMGNRDGDLHRIDNGLTVEDICWGAITLVPHVKQGTFVAGGPDAVQTYFNISQVGSC